jgi:hypothetical protein
VVCAVTKRGDLALRVDDRLFRTGENRSAGAKTRRDMARFCVSWPSAAIMFSRPPEETMTSPVAPMRPRVNFSTEGARCHTGKLLCRTLDILHMAAAVSCGAHLVATARASKVSAPKPVSKPNHRVVSRSAGPLWRSSSFRRVARGSGLFDTTPPRRGLAQLHPSTSVFLKMAVMEFLAPRIVKMAEWPE